MLEETKKFREFLDENSLVYDTFDVYEKELTQVKFEGGFTFNFSNFKDGKTKINVSAPHTADDAIEFIEMVLNR